MPRTSMTAILGYIRDLINDNGTTQIFDDDSMQNFCDRRRIEVRLSQLRTVYSVVPGGKIYYLDYYAEYGMWEADYVLQDNTWATVTATTSDLVFGHWSFTTEPSWPLYLTGKVYDIYAIAADLCEAWAAKVALKYDNQSGQFKNTRSQEHTHLMRQAKMFRAQAWVRSVPIVRNDMTGN